MPGQAGGLLKIDDPHPTGRVHFSITYIDRNDSLMRQNEIFPDYFTSTMGKKGRWSTGRLEFISWNLSSNRKINSRKCGDNVTGCLFYYYMFLSTISIDVLCDNFSDSKENTLQNALEYLQLATVFYARFKITKK